MSRKTTLARRLLWQAIRPSSEKNGNPTRSWSFGRSLEDAKRLLMSATGPRMAGRINNTH